MTTLLLRQESSDRAPAFPELGLSASKEPAEKFPKKHRRWAKSSYFFKGQILLYLTSGDGLGALCCHSHQRKLLLHQGCACPEQRACCVPKAGWCWWG